MSPSRAETDASDNPLTAAKQALADAQRVNAAAAIRRDRQLRELDAAKAEALAILAELKRFNEGNR